ncbi:Smr/MutS family protein [Streptomyces sp. NPDC008125]|uniref:Smr/MutS family protein n=1 Tax=Streptomyces sp. NPDC008125 TaxID=3364811 RepID=UPI0036E7F744
MRSLDLHPIFRNNRDIDQAVRSFVFNAHGSGESVAEIITGKGSQRLMTHVLAYLGQRHMRRFYRQVKKVPANAGRIVIHFT